MPYRHPPDDPVTAEHLHPALAWLALRWRRLRCAHAWEPWLHGWLCPRCGALRDD